MDRTDRNATAARSSKPLGRLQGWLVRTVLHSRHGGVVLFGAMFVLMSSVIRLALFLRSLDTLAWDWTLPVSFLVGFVFDVMMALVFALPLAVLFAVVPARWFTLTWFRGTIHSIFILALALMIFGAIAEWVFWAEFFVRFNFVAVDYLVYTREILGNIWQTFNIPLLGVALVLATGAIYGCFLSTGCMRNWLNTAATQRGRWVGLLAVLLPNSILAGLTFFIGAQEHRLEEEMLDTFSQGLRHLSTLPPAFDNTFNTELAKNGEYALLAAFLSNDLGYAESYPSLPRTESYARLRNLLAQDNATFIGADPADITRSIAAPGTARRLNVIQITVESLSAEYLSEHAGSPYAGMGLTPNLDRIARDSVWFKNCYASGTRTTHGIEALMLSVPPTPGQAVLRRPDSKGLFTLGGVFQGAGYDTAFIYGGNGTFDNMNLFFGDNGFRVIDRAAKLAADNPAITFENIWGVCDEDLLDWVLVEADRSHAQGRKFYHFAMTLSNHRPYTWPEGRIDISADARSREGGVKYTDYALGRFFAEAEKRPWFKDTVFVIAADHCASVAGAREIEAAKYRIPLFIYAPQHFAPRQIDTLCSQVDVAPTLLGLLDWSYHSRFLGRDVLRSGKRPDRAFMRNYQKLGVMSGHALAVLKPVATVDFFACDPGTGTLAPTPPDPELVADTIAYYQCASELIAQGRQKKIGPIIGATED